MPGSLRETNELEVKLTIPPGFELPPLEGEALDPTAFTSTYVDTPDRRLARSRITLRRRVEHGKSVWQLKLPQSEGRLESRSPAGRESRPRRSGTSSSRSCAAGSWSRSGPCARGEAASGSSRRASR